MFDELIEIVTWLGLLGVPTIFSMTVWCVRCCLQYTKKLNILAKAQQAQMRSQLIAQYHLYMEDGWISEEHMEDWECQYQAYHSLGENGVLDHRREELLDLKSKGNFQDRKGV